MTDKVVPLKTADQHRAEALAEVMEHLTLSNERPLTDDEHKRLREAEARHNRRRK